MNKEIFDITGESWHEIRRKHIGGSEVASLFGVGAAYQLSPYALFMVKSGQAEDDFAGNERTTWGNRLEGVIASGLAEDNGWTIRKAGYFEDDQCSGMGATLDFIITEAEGKDSPGALEIKNVDSLVFKNKWTDGEPPLHILLQLQHQLACSGLSWGVVGALVGGNETRMYFYERNEKIISQIRTKVAEFWDDVANNRAPAIDGSDRTKQLINDSVTVDKGRVVSADDDEKFTGLCKEYIDVNQQIKDLIQVKNKIHSQLVEAYGDAAVVNGDGYRMTASVTPAKPERLAEPGEVIPGRAEVRRYTVKEV